MENDNIGIDDNPVTYEQAKEWGRQLLLQALAQEVYSKQYNTPYHSIAAADGGNNPPPPAHARVPNL